MLVTTHWCLVTSAQPTPHAIIQRPSVLSGHTLQPNAHRALTSDQAVVTLTRQWSPPHMTMTHYVTH